MNYQSTKKISATLSYGYFWVSFLRETRPYRRFILIIFLAEPQRAQSFLCGFIYKKEHLVFFICGPGAFARVNIRILKNWYRLYFWLSFVPYGCNYSPRLCESEDLSFFHKANHDCTDIQTWSEPELIWHWLPVWIMTITIHTNSSLGLSEHIIAMGVRYDVASKSKNYTNESEQLVCLNLDSAVDSK